MSVFNGREPDERRYDFAFAALDSVAGRVWFLPTESLALQVSAGHLDEAEPGPAGTPSVNADRFTTSATYHRRFSGSHFLGDDPRLGGQPRIGRCNQRRDREIERQPVGTDAWFGRVETERKPGRTIFISTSRTTFYRREAPGGLHSIL